MLNVGYFDRAGGNVMGFGPHLVVSFLGFLISTQLLGEHFTSVALAIIFNFRYD